MSRKLAEILVKDRVIPEKQFQEAEAASQSGKSFIRYLIEKQYVSETKLLYYLSQKFGLPSINLAKFEVSTDVIRLVPPDLARRCQCIPIQSNGGTLVVAVCDPTVLPQLEDLKFKLKTNIEAVLTSYSAFDEGFQKYYSGIAFVGAAMEKHAADSSRKGADVKEDRGLELVEVHDIDSSTTADDAPVVTLVNGILSEAIRQEASDIHVEPYEKRFRVRMRMDGVLHEVAQVPTEMKRAVIARFKIMSRMDIAESRLPQDGRIKLRTAGKEIDFRVNTLPTMYGEKVVLRLLSAQNLQLDMTKLGFEAKQLEVFKKGVYAPSGMVLVTGPTGSGKTTTLYSALSELNDVQDNISTVEDPVEYNLEGVNQVQVHKDIGLTFANVLRAMLRQDPDTILVGEIRDYETAEVAVQASLTGHLVLSTLHTNDAPSTIIRLMNMGIEPFLLVACINTIVAQRLLRTICPSCKTDQPVPTEKLIQLGFPAAVAPKIHAKIGKGCKQCSQTGYRGRIAIYEVLDFTTTLKEMVLKGSTAIELKKAAVKSGMKTLRMSALTKMAEGVTTLEEALSMTMES